MNVQHFECCTYIIMQTSFLGVQFVLYKSHILKEYVLSEKTAAKRKHIS